MGDFPVVMFDEDTTEPEKNKQIPSGKKKTHLQDHLPIFAGFHGFTAAVGMAFVHLLTQTDL
jgi:hypothetical protein